MGEVACFGTTTRWRLSAFQTLSFEKRLTFTLRPSEFTFTFATKNMCDEPSVTPPAQQGQVESYLGHRSPLVHRTN